MFLINKCFMDNKSNSNCLEVYYEKHWIFYTSGALMAACVLKRMNLGTHILRKSFQCWQSNAKSKTCHQHTKNLSEKYAICFYAPEFWKYWDVFKFEKNENKDFQITWANILFTIEHR